MAEIERIADFGDLNGEAPVWDACSHSLYWTDCVGFRFYRYDARSGKPEILKQNFEVTGYALHEGGGFVIANTKGIWIWDGADRLVLLADQIDGAVCQMNDAAADPQGRFLAGSCFYHPREDYPLGCLFCVHTNGKAVILDEGIKLANGIGFSPDGSELYFTDSAERVIYRYDYNVETGEARNRSVLVRVSLDEGVPDGLAVDAEGYLWSAQWYGGCIVRYDPEGVIERRIEIPAKQTSSLAFGGQELSDIYVTSAAQPFLSPLSPRDYRPEGSCLGGPLYKVADVTAGKPQFRARISKVG